MNQHDPQPERDILDQAADALRDAPTPNGPPANVVASTVEALQSQTHSPKTIRQQRRQLMIRIAGLSGLAASVALIAMVLGSFLLDQRLSYAFGDVITEVQKAKSVIFNNKQRIGDQPEFEFTWYIRGDQFRIEMPNVMAQIVDLKKKKGIQLNMVKKTAKLMTIEDNTAKVFANPLEQLYRVKPNAAKKIGREKLGTLEVDVYRIKNIDFLGLKGKGEMTLWVNPKTQLPVRIQIGVNTRSGAKDTDRPFDTQFTLNNFSWHASLDDSLFRMQVPEGYTTKKK